MPNPNTAIAACLCLLSGALAQTPVKLFDGKTTKGWHIQGEGAWRAENGMLIGTHAASGTLFGHLVSDSAYTDFTFRYQWKLIKGNSGLYYHSAEGGDAGMIGPQVEMDGAFPGGIYTTNTVPWGWVVQPKSEDVKKWYKPDDWNLVTVTAKGPHVAIAYNGIPTAETSDARLPLKGRFGFQVHANTDCEIWIKEIELTLPAPTGLAVVDGIGKYGNATRFGASAAGGPGWIPGNAERPWSDLLGRYRTMTRSGSGAFAPDAPATGNKK